METAGKLVDDDQLKEALKAKGLGTPATRAAIIETLLRRRYIERDKKKLAATDLGRYLVAIIRDLDLKSPELTGQWEAKLRDIEAGRLAPRRFMLHRNPIMSLFEASEEANRFKARPLAARMRPESLEEFVGQEHFLGEGKLLRRLLAADRLGSVIFYARARPPWPDCWPPKAAACFASSARSPPA